MTRSFVFLSTLALLIGCGDDNQPSGPQDVSMQTFNVALAGAFIPFVNERGVVLPDAIAASDADLICLEEVWPQADKEAMRDAAADTFAHTAFFEDNLDTPIDDPTDQTGQVPPTPTTVPCPDIAAGDATIADQMNAAVDCVRDNCSTIPGDDEGRTTSTDCAAAECVGAVGPLLLGDEQQQRCYACMVTQLPTSTFGEIRDSCTTVVNQDLAFEGQNGVMILSRYPLKNEKEWVLPGTWNRRTILSATVELPNGAELDAYCNHLTPIFNDFTFPYTGQYGDGMTGAAGWEAEQALQAQKLIDYVASNSGDRPAVILGDFNAGHAFPAQDIAAEGSDTLTLLESAFPEALTADYVPQCTFCSSNPVTNPTADPEQPSSWIDHILLSNLPSSAVMSSSRVFDQDVVPVEGGDMVPLSDHFGMQAVVTVPAPSAP